MLLASLLIGLATVVYGWAWRWTPALEGDSRGYLAVAADLTDGTLDQLHDRPVGYPLLLLVTGSTPDAGTTLLVTQLALHGLAVLAAVCLLRRLRVGPAAVAIFAGISFLPPFVEHAGFVLSETLAQLLVVSGIVGFVLWLLDASRAGLLASALSLSVVGLVHPGNQLVWLVLPASSLAFCIATRAPRALWRRTLRGALALSCLAVLVLGGTVAWNATRFGFFGTSPMLGKTLSHKTVRVVERLPDEYAGARAVLLRHRDAALLDPATGHLGLAYIFRAIPDLEAETGLQGAELSAYLVRLNLALIRRAPMDYVDEVLRSAVWYWAPGVTDRSGFGSGALKAGFNALRAGVLVAFGLTVVLLAGPSVLLARVARRSTTGWHGGGMPEPLARMLLAMSCMLGAILCSCAVSTTLTAAVYRLRIPFDLPILAFACMGPAVWVLLRAALGGQDPARPRAGSY